MDTTGSNRSSTSADGDRYAGHTCSNWAGSSSGTTVAPATSTAMTASSQRAAQVLALLRHSILSDRARGMVFIEPSPGHDHYPEGDRPEWALQCRA
jgi:hypothetical protein